MILGYHERKDLRLELTVKNVRTREFVDLEKLGIQSLIPLHDYGSHLSYEENLENCVFSKEMAKLYDELELKDVKVSDYWLENNEASGVNASGDHYAIFVNLYDVSINDYVKNSNGVFIGSSNMITSTKRVMMTYGSLAWNTRVETISKIGDRGRFELPAKLHPYFSNVTEYAIKEGCFTNGTIYIVTFNDGTTKKCHSKKAVREVIEAKIEA